MNHSLVRSASPLAFALSVILLPLARGADTYQGNRWALLEPAPVIAAAASVDTHTYPGCDEVTVDQRSVRSYRSDGTAETQDETWTKVLTERGKDDQRVLTQSFMLPYSDVQVVRLEVIHPDGRVTPVDVAANSKESIDESQMAMNIYDPNSKVLQVNIPDLGVGDMVHAVARQTILRPIIPGEFADQFLLEGRGAIRHTSIAIYAPADKKLQQVALRDPVQGTVESELKTAPDGELVYEWEVNHVPRMYDEPSMPSYEEVLQRLWVSTLPDWQAVSRWYWNLSKAHLSAVDPAMKAKVAALTAGAPDDLAKTKAIFYYVSKNIRYMGVTAEKDRPGFEPHDVCLTYDKKYGVCRDKAALLVEMLRLAGLEAYPVLTNVGAKRDASVASPDFNHAIAAVCLTPGTYTLMDATDENTRDLFPSYESNQSYLVCRPDGETLRTSPVKPAAENLLTVRTSGTLDAGGHLEANSKLSFSGINDNEFRAVMARMKPEVRRQFFEKLLSRSVPGVTLKSLTVTPVNMLDTSVPVQAEVSFVANGLTATGGGTAIVTLPWVGKNFAIVNYLLGGAGLDSRKYPLQISAACGLKEELDLKVGSDYTGIKSLPKFQTVEDPDLGYSRSLALADGRLIGALDFELKTVEFSPAEYLKLKAMLTQVDEDNRMAPVLAYAGGSPVQPSVPVAAAAAPAASDVQILTNDRIYDVRDAHNWTLTTKIRLKVLTYDGKKKSSELKVAYNPACEEVRLVHAFVIATDGHRQDVSEGEEHRMDAAWNAGAKRYPGGKVYVVNLPGVEVGSVIDLEYQVVNHDRPFFAGFEPLQLNDAVDARTVRIHTPAGLLLHLLRTGPQDIGRETNGTDATGQFREWTVVNQPALPDEPSLPPDWTYRAGIAFSVGNPWEYYQQVNDRMLACAAQSARASARARELAKAAASPVEAVRSIRNFIASTVRVSGPKEFYSLPLSALSSADTTFADGYGDAADVAILYHAMLAAAGLKPEFVLASELTPAVGVKRVVDSVPMPQAFSVPLVRVEAGGETFYLNDTDQYARLGSTAHEGLLAVSLGRDSFEVVQPAVGGGTRTERFCRMTLQDDGTTQFAFRTLYYGKAFNKKSRFFSQLTPEDRIHYYQEQVSNVAQGARAVGGLTTRFDSYPGVEEFSVEVSHYAIADGRYEYFPLPVSPRLVPASDDHRDLPLYIGSYDDERTKLEIELPAGHRRVVIAPSNRFLLEPDGGGSARIKQEREGGNLLLSYDLEVDPAIIPAADYEALKQVDAELQQKSSRIILLESPDSAGQGT